MVLRTPLGHNPENIPSCANSTVDKSRLRRGNFRVSERNRLRQPRQSRIKCRTMQIPGVLPNFLKVWWIWSSPFAFLFAGRILWEKTIWTWSSGPQAIGFALFHIHPVLAAVGTLCSLGVALWLLLAVPYAIARRHNIEPWDWLIMAGSIFVIVVLALPDTFFA